MRSCSGCAGSFATGAAEPVTESTGSPDGLNGRMAQPRHLPHVKPE